MADLKLAVNFKKIGAKMGPKIKSIMAASKSGEWQENSEGGIDIAGVILGGDDFELKLTPKDSGDKGLAIQALPDNSHLISLDINVTEELKNEGVARDIVRLVQQARKDADLNVSDKIELSVGSDSKEIKACISNFKDYIAKQVLANSVNFSENLSEKEDSIAFYSTGKTEIAEVEIEITKK